MAIMTGWRNQRPLERSLTPRPRRHWALGRQNHSGQQQQQQQQTRALQQL